MRDFFSLNFSHFLSLVTKMKRFRESKEQVPNKDHHEEYKIEEKEVILKFLLDGDGHRSLQAQDKFQKDCESITGTEKLILEMETTNVDHWPTITTTLDLSALPCKSLIVKNSFFQIIPPTGLVEFECAMICAYYLYDTQLPKLRKLIVTSDDLQPPELLEKNYPSLETLDIRCTKDNFDIVVNAVVSMNLTRLKCLDTIKVTDEVRTFTRTNNKSKVFPFMFFVIIFFLGTTSSRTLSRAHI